MNYDNNSVNLHKMKAQLITGAPSASVISSLINKFKNIVLCSAMNMLFSTVPMRGTYAWYEYGEMSLLTIK